MNLNLSTPENNAQFAHIGWGAMVTFILALLGMPTWLAAMHTSVFAAAKEYIEYKWGIWEARTPALDSAVDFLFFAVGIAIAIVILVVR